MHQRGYAANAENIAASNSTFDPAGQAVIGWVGSPSHMKNLSNPLYTHTGIGFAKGSDGTYYFTQIFGGDGRRSTGHKRCINTVSTQGKPKVCSYADAADLLLNDTLLNDEHGKASSELIADYRRVAELYMKALRQTGGMSNDLLKKKVHMVLERAEWLKENP